MGALCCVSFVQMRIIVDLVPAQHYLVRLVPGRTGDGIMTGHRQGLFGGILSMRDTRGLLAALVGVIKRRLACIDAAGMRGCGDLWFLRFIAPYVNYLIASDVEPVRVRMTNFRCVWGYVFAVLLTMGWADNTHRF